MFDLFDICAETMLLRMLSCVTAPQTSSLETFKLRISSSFRAALINFLLFSSTTNTFHCTRGAVVSRLLLRGRGCI